MSAPGVAAATYLSNREAHNCCDAFLIAMYGIDVFRQWKSLKREMNFGTERELMVWVLELVQTSRHEYVGYDDEGDDYSVSQPQAQPYSHHQHVSAQPVQTASNFTYPRESPRSSNNSYAVGTKRDYQGRRQFQQHQPEAQRKLDRPPRNNNMATSWSASPVAKTVANTYAQNTSRPSGGGGGGLKLEMAQQSGSGTANGAAGLEMGSVAVTDNSDADPPQMSGEEEPQGVAAVSDLVTERGNKPTCFCRYCGKGFMRERHKTRHENTLHLTREKVACPVCEREFSRRDNLKVHLDKRHPEYEGGLPPVLVTDCHDDTALTGGDAFPEDGTGFHEENDELGNAIADSGAIAHEFVTSAAAVVSPQPMLDHSVSAPTACKMETGFDDEGTSLADDSAAGKLPTVLL